MPSAKQPSKKKPVASDSKDPWEKVPALEEEIKVLQEEKKKLTEEKISLKEEINTLRKSLQEAQKSIHELNEQISQLENQSNKPGLAPDGLVATLTILLKDIQDFYKELEPIRTDLLRLENLEKELEEEKGQIRSLQNNLDLLNNKFKDSQAELSETRKKKDEIQEECDLVQQEKNKLLRKIEDGNHIIDTLNERITDLQKQKEQNKLQIGIEWAQGIAHILSKLSSLAELEPQSEINLKPKSVYEELLKWMNKAFGERPEKFPPKQELVTSGANGPEILLDPDKNSLEYLLSRFDWSPDRPFEGLPTGNRKRSFRVLQWGWKVQEKVLVKAKVFPIPVEPENTKLVSREESNGKRIQNKGQRISKKTT